MAPDLKGHGDSGRPGSGYRLEDQAAELRQFCQHLGLRRVRVIGHSWGGGIAVHLAAMAPELVERLVLEDPALLIDATRAGEFGDRFAQQVGLSPKAARAPVTGVLRTGRTWHRTCITAGN